MFQNPRICCDGTHSLEFGQRLRVFYRSRLLFAPEIDIVNSKIFKF